MILCSSLSSRGCDWRFAWGVYEKGSTCCRGCLMIWVDRKQDSLTFYISRVFFLWHSAQHCSSSAMLCICHYIGRLLCSNAVGCLPLQQQLPMHEGDISDGLCDCPLRLDLGPLQSLHLTITLPWSGCGAGAWRGAVGSERGRQPLRVQPPRPRAGAITRPQAHRRGGAPAHQPGAQP